MTGTRRSIATGAPWERTFGYHRAVSVSDRAWVSGTTAASTGQTPSDDVSVQTHAAFTIALDALKELGFDRSDVVRTRMYVIDMRDADAVGRVHGLLFEGVNPASTMVGVAALIDPRLRIEVEVDAAKAPQ